MALFDDVAAIAKAAATFKASFEVTEQYWTAKKVDDAVASAKAAVERAELDLEPCV